jgi:hypothetical protein
MRLRGTHNPRPFATLHAIEIDSLHQPVADTLTLDARELTPHAGETYLLRSPATDTLTLDAGELTPQAEKIDSRGSSAMDTLTLDTAAAGEITTQVNTL